MVAEIHQLKTKPVAVNWMCSACGVDAGCNCGAPLMSKGQRAAEAIAANPQKSDRAIAADLGINNATVSRARQATVADATVDVWREAFANAAREPRTGRDGKTRRLPVRAPVENDDDEMEAATPAERRASFLIFSNEALLMAKYEGPIDDEILSAAKATAAAWSRLVKTMEEGK